MTLRLRFLGAPATADGSLRGWWTDRLPAGTLPATLWTTPHSEPALEAGSGLRLPRSRPLEEALHLRDLPLLVGKNLL